MTYTATQFKNKLHIRTTEKAKKLDSCIIKFKFEQSKPILITRTVEIDLGFEFN